MIGKKVWLGIGLTIALVAACGDDDAVVRDGGVGDSGPPVCSGGTTLCGTACADTQNDPAHCGGCDNACASGEACTAGVCGPVCPDGQEICDGACIDTSNDRRHCGACGAACGAGEICTDGSCMLSCPAGQTVCGSACAATDSNPLHCGACDAACASGQVCSEGVCTSSCTGSLVECAGACVDLNSSADHCGACGTACPGADGATGLCTAGTCQPVCDLLLADCNADLGSPGGNGCETPVGSDPRNCGACGLTCSLPNAIPGCSVGTCAVSGCAAGWGDCDGLVTNGCETDVSSDNFSCGACGTVCAMGERCVASVCEPIIGEDCSSPLTLTDGTNSVMWGAFVNDFLTPRPSCTSSNVDGPDIVLTYTATTTGEHTFTLNPPSSTRWVMVASDAPCGTVNPVQCDSEYGNPITVDPYLTAGSTIHLYVADTTSGPSPLDNPLSVEVTPPSCATPTAPAITSLTPADGSVTATLTPRFEVALDGPIYRFGGMVTITGDRGTALTYDLSTAPAEVTFSADEATMTIAPTITFPSYENLTITWTGLIGKACGTPIPAPTWGVRTVCLEAFCATCTDGVANGAETDVDCGGATTCPRCPDFGRCTAASDCVAAVCTSGYCGSDPCVPFGSDSGYTGCSFVPTTLPCPDIRSSGTATGLFDDDNVQVPVGFSFSFYGTSYTNATIQSNGAISFDNFNLTYINSCSLRTTTPNKLIQAFWDDMDPSAPGSGVYYETRGTAPNRTFIVQWDTQHYDLVGTGNAVYTAVLHETTNEIDVCYVDTVFDVTSYDSGASATIGVQNGTENLQYSCNMPNVESGRLIRYLPR